jgi:DNA-binding protein HU-beta
MVNRRELVKAIAAHTGVDAKQVDAVVHGLVEVITAMVARGEMVSISGFARFFRRELRAREGRNPATGEPIHIEPVGKARIIPMKHLRDAASDPSTAPRLAKGVWPSAAAARKAAPQKKSARKKSAPKKAAAKKATKSRTKRVAAR